MALDSAAADGLSPAKAFATWQVPPDGLLAASRLLGGADVLFPLVQRLLGTVGSRLGGAQACLGLLAQPGTPAESWAEVLLRYRQATADLRASLIAARDIGQGLLEAGLEDEYGFADSLGLLEQLTTYLPPVPPDPGAAQKGVVALAEMAAALAMTQARFAACQSRIEAGLSSMPEEAAGAGLEPALLEGTDLEKEAFRLQALQVRQQLAGHAIGLHALVPRCLQELDEG